MYVSLACRKLAGDTMWIGGPTFISMSFGILRPCLPEKRAIMPSGMKALYCCQFEIVILVPARMVPFVPCKLLSISKELKSVAASLLLSEISFGRRVLGITCMAGGASTMPRVALTAPRARDAIGAIRGTLGLTGSGEAWVQRPAAEAIAPPRDEGKSGRALPAAGIPGWILR